MSKKKSKGVQKTIDDYIKANPIKRGRDGKGTYMRWGKSTGKKYYYKAGNKASREKARKKAQAQARAAYAGGYRGNPEHAEDYMVPRDIHRAVKSAMVLESRYEEGMEVPIYYDPMLSKLITYGKDRKGPPVGGEISIQVTGPDFEELISQVENMRKYKV